MRAIGIREFRDQASSILAGGETLVIERRGEPIGFFVPITAKDRRAGRQALGRLGTLVDDIAARSGLDEDELAQEIAPRRPRALMRLVVDTSVLVGELLRTAGRTRLGDDRLELYLPEQMWGETQVELPRRIIAFVRRRGLEPKLGDELAAACLAAVETNVVVLDEGIYAALEDEARERSLRDPRDWPVVASALALNAAVWTKNNFLGTGVATWTTDTLHLWLQRQPDR